MKELTRLEYLDNNIIKLFKHCDINIIITAFKQLLFQVFSHLSCSEFTVLNYTNV